MNLEYRELERRVDRLDAAIERIDKNLDTLAQDVRSLNTRIDGVYNQMQSLSGRITNIMTGLAVGVVLAVIGGVVTVIVEKL